MTAPDLFDRLRAGFFTAGESVTYPIAARKDDPPASHAAARANKAEREAQRHAILLALATAGREGCTNDSLDAMHLWRAGTASRRTAELIRDGHVRRLLTTRKTRTGSPAHVLVLARAEGVAA